MPNHYAKRKETPIRTSPKKNAKVAYYALMGQLLISTDEQGDWFKVIPLNIGSRGWVHKDDIVPDPMLKMFIVDVGQGDGVFLECQQGLIIIDGGQYDNFYRYLRYRYKGILKNRNVQIKAMFISHPDYDHYNGLNHILEDKRFEIDTIYHNGIVRYNSSIERSITKFENHGGMKPIQHDTYSYKIANLCDDLDDIQRFIDSGDAAPAYKRFWNNVKEAKDEGRVNKVRMLTSRDEYVPGFKTNANNNLRIEVLGPVTLKQNGRREFPVFDKPPHLHEQDSGKQKYSHSHTRNGHSLVLKILYGNHSFLLGGDLNIPAEKYLMKHYGNKNPFKVDVAKSCHHGSSDFSVEFIKKINAHATVCSSGDNKTFDHPMPDSMGAAAKHGRGEIPLVFSTELGRAYNIRSAKKLDDIKTHYGLINIRSNGTDLVLAQKKESSKGADKWDSFEVPFKGKYKA